MASSIIPLLFRRETLLKDIDDGFLGYLLDQLPRIDEQHKIYIHLFYMINAIEELKPKWITELRDHLGEKGRKLVGYSNQKCNIASVPFDTAGPHLADLMRLIGDTNKSLYISLLSNFFNLDATKLVSKYRLDIENKEGTQLFLLICFLLLVPNFVFLKKKPGDQGEWHKFNGKTWKQVDMAAVISALVGLVYEFSTDAIAHYNSELSSLPESDEQTEEDKKEAKKLREFRKLMLSYRKLKTSSYKSDLPILAEYLTVNIWDLNTSDQSRYFVCHNGQIDLTSGELYPHTRLGYCTQFSATQYIPPDKITNKEQKNGEKCFRDFLKKFTCANAELEEFLQKVMGYAITGHNHAKQFFLLYNLEGYNGKSSFISLMRETFGGDYQTSLNISVLVQARKGSSAGSATSHLENLFGPRIGVVSECERESVFDEQNVKRITGGDDIAHRGLYVRKQQSDVATVKIFLASNDFPKAKWSVSFNRRVCCIPCDAVFVQGLQKDDFENKRFVMQSDFGDTFPKNKYNKEAFLRWCVEGAIMFYQDMAQGITLPRPKCVEDLTQSYLTGNNPLIRFIKDITDNTDRTYTLEKLLKRYMNWYETHHTGVCFASTNDLKKKLMALGYKLTDDCLVIVGDPHVTQPCFPITDEIFNE